MTATDENLNGRRGGDRATPVAERIDYEMTDGFVGLLEQLGCSLIISSYQASAVMIVGSLGDGRPVQSFAHFPAAMGLALDGDRLAVAMRSEVAILSNVRSLARTKPGAENIYGGYFVVRQRHVTGESAIHDMVFDGPDVIAVNTNYSCLCRLDGFHNFTPIWKPPFVSALSPDDLCHLNGMAIEQGRIRYVTALGQTDTPRGWHAGRYKGGVVLEVPGGRAVASGLCMPHSPRIIAGRLLLTEAGIGAIVEIDRATRKKRVIGTLPGFARGLAELGGYLFVGLSLPRGVQPFKDLPVAASGEPLMCGVAALRADTGEAVGMLTYTGGCTEIHDIQITTRARVMGISDLDGDATQTAIDLPDIGFWSTPRSAAPAAAASSASYIQEFNP
ncbi:TIGR03032 family protein [Sphingomonadaceae bacterium jetA1]|jgi:uncharacterized protein (TIGR03032 family)|uniref:TIGR03032 family protein n=1 Tax=Facivitalis istanbulensis TaxID=3075838 RepID=UPI0034789196